MSEVLNNAIDLNDYTQVTTLDGKDYLLRFMFNDREGKWYMHLHDEDDVPIVQGVKVVPGISLLRKVVDSRRPAGVLIARDLTVREVTAFGGGEQVLEEDPGLTDLGENVRIYYFPEDELT